jgi:hypothetical protein
MSLTSNTADEVEKGEWEVEWSEIHLVEGLHYRVIGSTSAIH